MAQALAIVGTAVLMVVTNPATAFAQDMGGGDDSDRSLAHDGESVGGSAPEVEAVSAEGPSPAPQPPESQDLTASAPVAQLSGTWRDLAMCESTLNPRAVSANGIYFGLYQFDQPTWISVGGLTFASRADRAAPTDQLTAAQRLHARRGWAPWPSCSRRLGLLR